MTFTAPRPDTAEPDAPAAFYVTGGTLGAGAPSYVERQADRDLLQGLTSGEYCYVLNSRQMGKSSLCVRTMARLRELGRRTCFLDLTKFGGRNLAPDQWYAALLAEAGRELGLRGEMLAFWKQNTELGPMQRFFGAIQQVALPASDAPLTVFVDEIDVTRGLPFSADEFFAGIRQGYVGRATDPALSRLTFCLLGTATPADLIQDTRTSPFNIGRRVEVKDFTAEEAAPLAAGLGADGSSLLSRVLYWTGGHPYLTQRLCRAAQESDASNAGDIDRLCSGLFLTRTAAEADDNLMFVRNRLLKSEVDLAGLLDLYAQMRRGRRVPDDEADPLCAVLKLSGVARSEAGVLRVRNRIYEHVFSREWIVEHTPGAELRRQREAYRRGLARAGAVAACVVLLLGLLAGWALVERSAARRALRQSQASAQAAATAAKTARAQQTIAVRETQVAQGQTRLAQANAHEADTQKKLAQANAARADTQSRLATHNAITTLLQKRRADLNAARNQQLAVQRQAALQAAQASNRLTERTLYDADMNLIQGEYENNNLSHVSQLLRDTRTSPDRGFEWGYWDRMCHLSLLTIPTHYNIFGSVSFSPDGRRIVTDGFYGTAHVWDIRDARTGAILWTIQWKNRGGFAVASFSPDGTRVVTAVGNDGAIQVRDARTGASLLTLQVNAEHPGDDVSISRISFSPDGRRIVAAGMEGTTRGNFWTASGWVARAWDARTGAVLWTTQENNRRGILAVSLDSTRLVTTGDDGGVQVRDTRTGKILLTLLGSNSSRVISASFSPDGTRIVTMNFDKTARVWDARVWDARTGTALWTVQRKIQRKIMMDFASASFSPDGTRIVTHNMDGNATVWDAQNGTVLWTIPGNNGEDFIPLSFSFSPDGRRIATSVRDGTVQVRDARTGKILLTLRGHTGPIYSAAFSPDGRRIATASNDGTIRVWDAQADRQALTLRGHTGTIDSAAFSPDGTRVVTAGQDGTARVWDARTGRQVRVLAGHTDAVKRVSYSPDGRRIVTASYDKTARVWDAHTGAALLTLRGHTDHVDSASYSPDGTRIVTASKDGTARVWDAHTGARLLTLQKSPKIDSSAWFRNAVISASFSPDGKHIVIAIFDGTVQVRDAQTGALLLTIQGYDPRIDSSAWLRNAVISASYSPDGTRVVITSNDGTARVWDARTGRQVRVLAGHTDTVESVSYSPDGRRIVTASYDKTARVWDAHTGATLLTLRGHTGPIYSAAFSPDGWRIVTAGEDGTAKIWSSDRNTRPTAASAAQGQAGRRQPRRAGRTPAAPLEATGYNAGLIAGGRYNSSSTSAALASVQRALTTTLDGAWDYYARGFNPAAPKVGLPVGEVFASRDDPSVRFRLRPPGKSSALLLTTLHDSATLTLAHPGRFRRLALLVTGANGAHRVRVRLNFAGGASLSETLVAPDNFSNHAPNIALSGFDRVCGTAHPNDETGNPGGFDGAAPANPTLFDAQIMLPKAEARRTLTSITLTKSPPAPHLGPDQNVAVFGLSGG